MTREETEAEVGRLLTKQRALARFNLALPPNENLLLSRLLQRLGWTGRVPMSRRKSVSRYAKRPRPGTTGVMFPGGTPADLITHAGHALDNPTDDTAIRSFADHLLETHPDDPHAQKFMEWVNGGGWSGRDWQDSPYHPRGQQNVGGVPVAGAPYLSLHARRVATPGHTGTEDDPTEPLGTLSKRLDSPYWEFTREGRATTDPATGQRSPRVVTTPRSPKFSSTEVAQHLYDTGGVQGLALGVIGARHFHPEAVNRAAPQGTTRPKFSRRTVTGDTGRSQSPHRYAKLPASETGTLTPEQLQILRRAHETGDDTGWGVLGDHLAENGFPGAGAVLSRAGSGGEVRHETRPVTINSYPETNNFSYAVVRDGSRLRHLLRLNDGELVHTFNHVHDPSRMSRRYAETPDSEPEITREMINQRHLTLAKELEDTADFYQGHHDQEVARGTDPSDPLLAEMRSNIALLRKSAGERREIAAGTRPYSRRGAVRRYTDLPTPEDTVAGWHQPRPVRTLPRAELEPFLRQIERARDELQSDELGRYRTASTEEVNAAAAHTIRAMHDRMEDAGDPRAEIMAAYHAPDAQDRRSRFHTPGVFRPITATDHENNFYQVVPGYDFRREENPTVAGITGPLRQNHRVRIFWSPSGQNRTGFDAVLHPHDARRIISGLPEEVATKLLSHLDAHQSPDPEPDHNTPAGKPDRMTRRVTRRYAKAEKDRHPAHALIAGHPIEHALRHLANDPQANDTLRSTAKHVLTTGDTSGLWAVHDLVQQHENADGTTGHPITKAGYNWMSAADKLHLDRHTHDALTAEGHEARRTAVWGVTQNPDFTYGPHHVAIHVQQGMRRGTQYPAQFHENRQLLDRVRARIKHADPHADDKGVDESIRRAIHRAWNEQSKVVGGTFANEDYPLQALRKPGETRSPGKVNYEPDPEQVRNEKATRFRRKPRRYTIEAPIKGYYVSCPVCGTKNVALSKDTHLLPCYNCGSTFAARGKGGLWDQLDETNYPPKPDPAPVKKLSRRLNYRYARFTVGPGESLMGGQDFVHPVHDETGARVGHVWVSPRGDHLHVNHVGMSGHAPNAVGPAGLRDLRDQLRAHYPAAKTVGGTRVSGAVRRNTGGDRPTVRPLSRKRVVVRRYNRDYTHADFQQKIASEPGNKTTDLVYADWLQEHGLEHVPAFIRFVTGQLGQPHKESQFHTAGRNLWKTQPLDKIESGAGSVGWRGKGRGRPVGNGFVVHVKVPNENGGHIEYWSQPMSPEDATVWGDKLKTENGPHKLSRKVVRYAAPNRSDFLSGLQKAFSSNYRDSIPAMEDVARRMGAEDVHTLPALHVSPGGSVPGFAQAIYGPVKPETVHGIASFINGLLTNSPGYGVFHVRASGPDTIYRLRKDGSGLDLKEQLEREGIRASVLLHQGKGFDVLVPDRGNKLQQQVESFVTRHGVDLEASPGHFQTVGGSTEQSGNREQYRNRVVKGEQSKLSRKVVRYAMIEAHPTLPQWDVITDHSVPVITASHPHNPGYRVGEWRPARRNDIPNSPWVWTFNKEVGTYGTEEEARQRYPHAVSENDIYHNRLDHNLQAPLTPHEVWLATEGVEGQPENPDTAGFEMKIRQEPTEGVHRGVYADYLDEQGNSDEAARQRKLGEHFRGTKFSRRKPKRYSTGPTTEDDFHRMLDANPDDHHTRLVLADYLQERGDPRAEGYRALGTLRVRPWDQDLGEQYNSEPGYTHPGNQQVAAGDPRYTPHALPHDWFHQIEGENSNPSWTFHDTRREAEDAAALAFSRLPPERQAEITSTTGTKLSRRRPRRYSLNDDIATLTHASRRQQRGDDYSQDTNSGKVLGDALDEAGEPHAPFYRNLTPSGSLYDHEDQNGLTHGTSLSGIKHHNQTPDEPFSLISSVIPGKLIAHRRDTGVKKPPTHTAVMDAPALREWADHPKVGPSLRAALLNAASHLESTTGGAEKLSRRRAGRGRQSFSRRLLCRS